MRLLRKGKEVEGEAVSVGKAMGAVKMAET